MFIFEIKLANDSVVRSYLGPGEATYHYEEWARNNVSYLIVRPGQPVQIRRQDRMAEFAATA